MYRPIISFAPMFDSPLRKDATKAFLPEAERFSERHGGRLFKIDNSLPDWQRADLVQFALSKANIHATPWEAIAFFCHGTKRNIQLGFNVKNIDALAQTIRETSRPDVVVALYCCSTAMPWISGAPGGEGGFADVLRDAIGGQCVVWAHETKGHTTKNPRAIAFYGADAGVKHTGRAVFPKRSGAARAQWQRWIARLKTDYRFDFPFRTLDEIRSEV